MRKWTYLGSMLYKLHPAILQLDQADPHPPEELQVLWVISHEVLGPKWSTTHSGLPEKKRKKQREDDEMMTG